jgi:DNA polymerase-3 subunit delta'
MPAPAFVGHKRIANSLWRMVLEGRLPQTLLFAGQRGIGKTTLARHLAAGINCASGPGRPCGSCSPCQRILAADLSKEEYRKVLADRRKLPAAKRSEYPLIVATHPDVLIFPPDGPMRMIGIDQARLLRNQARISPSEGRRRIFVIKDAERANAEAANALLKTLEEPASKLTIILTSVNPYLMPATIRSRSIPFYFGALSPVEMETFLQARKDIPDALREQVSAWSRGSPGVALSIDVGEFLARRKAMLALVRTALAKGEFVRLAREMDAIARNQSEGIDRLAEMLSSLLRDLLRLHLNVKGGLTHRDISTELAELASLSTFAWTERAVNALDKLEKLQQTNIQKQIALEAYALSLRK